MHAVSAHSPRCAPRRPCRCTVFVAAFASGAHISPSVSLASGLSGHIPWLRALSYVVAQVGDGASARWWRGRLGFVAGRRGQHRGAAPHTRTGDRTQALCAERETNHPHLLLFLCHPPRSPALRAQFVGTLGGTALQLFMVPGLHAGDAKAAACHGPMRGMGGTDLFLWEALLTFVFVFVLYGEGALGWARAGGGGAARHVCARICAHSALARWSVFDRKSSTHTNNTHFFPPTQSTPAGAMLHPPGHGAIAPLSAGITLFALLSAGALRTR
jgi:glycerol uptake facilitator-like aquaporin